MIKVDRRTGRATTSRIIRDRQEAWQRAIDLETPIIFTTVVQRKEA